MRLLTIVSVVAFLLAACGQSSEDGASASSVSVSDVASGLQAGQLEVRLDGQVVIVDGVTIDRETVEIFPRSYSSSRQRDDGTGGRNEVPTTNAEGPYRVQFWLGLQRGEESPGMGRIYIQLPPDAEAGRRYVMRDSRRASHGEAYGGVVGPGQAWQLNRNLDGTVELVEAGDALSLTFEFSNDAEPGTDNYFEASGRVYRVPVRPRAEAQFSMSVDGEQSDHVAGLMRQDQASRFVALVPNLFALTWEAAPEPGEYRIGARRGPGIAGLNLIGLRVDEVDGTVTLVRDGDHYSANYRFSVSGESEVEIEGRFEHLAISEHLD